MRANMMGAAALALACAPGVALAQSPSPIVPQDRPDQTPVQAPPVAQAPAQAPTHAEVQEVTPFRLERVEVQGSTLPAPALEAAWRPFGGQTIDRAGVAAVTDAIIKAYEQSDIALYTVLVPAQDFAGGVLRVDVLEGYVESVTVTGAEGASVRPIAEGYLEKLKTERPLRRSTLERYISLTRDLPGLRSELRFVNGGGPAAVGVVAELKALPVQVAFSMNNRGAAFLGRTQVGVDLYLNSLIAGGQTRLSLVAPTDFERFKYVGLSHSQLLGVSGASVQANVGYLRTRPRGSDLEGKATSAGLQVTYPLVRSYNRDLLLTAGVDGLNANSVLLGGAFSDDRTRAARVNLYYAEQAPRSRLTLSSAASIGLDILGAKTLVPDFTDLEYFKLNGRATYARQVGDGLFLRLAMAGQWSGDRLPASEQFALGGNEFGRAFETAVLTGDLGYAGSAELAYRPEGLPDILQDGEAYGFIDGGETFYRHRAFAQSFSEALSSVGAGVRTTVQRHVALQLEAAQPLGASLPVLRSRGPRLIFSVRSVW